MDTLGHLLFLNLTSGNCNCNYFYGIIYMGLFSVNWNALFFSGFFSTTRRGKMAKDANFYG
jgi:hypothetical protein